MPMPCPTLLEVECLAAPYIKSGIGHAASGAASSAAGDFLDALASGIRDAVTWMFTNATTWWLKLPAPDLARQPAITTMRQWLLPVTAAVAVGGMIAAGIRMIVTRRANPLLDVGTGLITIAAAATLGVAIPDLLLQAGDTWSNWALNSSTGGAFGTRLSDMLTAGGAPAMFVIVLGNLALVMGAVQAVLLIFRQAAVIILAAVMPLAAAGATAPLTRSWIRKIISWMLALIAYKPAAAAVYAAAFTMIGKGSGLEAIMMGFAMLALSLLAMPVLMRFFTWTTGTISSSGGSQFLGMATAGAVAVGALRGSSDAAGGTTADEHASYMSSRRQPSASASADGAATVSATSGSPMTQGGTAGPDGNSATGRTSRPGTANPAGAGGAGAPGGTGTSAAVANGASAASTDGSQAATAAPTGAAASSTEATGATATGAATGGAATAAMIAAQGLASGARNAAADTTEDGEQR